MIDYGNLKLMHYHGDELVPLAETASHHDSASHDAERGIGWYRRIFRCTTCEEEIVVDAKQEEPSQPS
jgi:hypothetical protein